MTAIERDAPADVSGMHGYNQPMSPADEDDWVGTPPEGRHSRDRADPGYWNRRWPCPRTRSATSCACAERRRGTRPRMNPRARRVALVQSAYFVATGVAPFVSRRAFEAVTGPKREWWLVETVGAVVTVIGAALASAVAHDRVTPE